MHDTIRTQKENNQKNRLRVKNMSLVATVLIAVVFFSFSLFYTLFFSVAPSATVNAVKPIRTQESLTGNFIGGRYPDSFSVERFPEFKANAKEVEWEVSYIDKNTPTNIGYTLFLKNQDDTISFHFYNNSEAVKKDITCFAYDDIRKIDQNFYREKIKTKNGKHIGYYYLQAENYTFKSSADFEKYYQDYINFQTQNNLSIIDEEQIAACGNSHRTNFTKVVTSKLENTQNYVVENLLMEIPLAISVNNADTTAESLLKIENEIIKNLDL